MGLALCRTSSDSLPLAIYTVVIRMIRSRVIRVNCLILLHRLLDLRTLFILGICVRGLGISELSSYFCVLGGALALVLIVGLMFKGQEWRERLGEPRNVKALDTEEM